MAQALAAPAPFDGPARKTLHERLTRRTSGGTFLPEVDGLRCVCIAAVVLFHLNGYLSEKFSVGAESSLLYRLSTLGHWGVQAFFIISGFVLARPFVAHNRAAGPPVRLLRYFQRRLTRLEPPFVLAVFGIACLQVLMGIASPTRDWAMHLLATATYTHGLLYGSTSPISVVTWSLEIEIQFYLLAPAIFQVFRLRPLFSRMTLGAGVVIFWFVSSRLDGAWQFVVVRHIHFFLLGALLAERRMANEIDRATLINRVAPFSLAVCLFAFGYFQEASELLSAGLIMAMTSIALSCPVVWPVLQNPFVTVIGGMCYTIYLWHYIVISAVGRFVGGVGKTLPYPLHLSIQTLLQGTALITFGVALYVTVERPTMDPKWHLRVARFLSRLRFRSQPTRRAPDVEQT